MMKQVCYGILGKTGLHMSESCICEDADELEGELEYAQEDFPDEDFQIVPLYALVDDATLVSAQPGE